MKISRNGKEYRVVYNSSGEFISITTAFRVKDHRFVEIINIDRFPSGSEWVRESVVHIDDLKEIVSRLEFDDEVFAKEEQLKLNAELAAAVEGGTHDKRNPA